MSKDLKAHFLLILHTIISSGNYIAVKIVMQSQIDPLLVIWLRVICAVAFFWTLTRVFHIKEKIQPKYYYLLLICALGGSVLNQLGFYYGMKYTTPINASILNLFYPLTVLAFSIALVKEKISKITLLGFFLSLIAGLLIVDVGGAGFGSHSILGDTLIIFNAIFFGAYVVAVSRLLLHYHTFTVTLYMLCIGLIMITPFAIEPIIEFNAHVIDTKLTWAIAYILIANTFIAYLLTNYIPKLTSPYIMSMYVYLQPVFTAIFMAVLYGEFITLRKVVCGTAVVAGILLAQYGRKQKSQN